MNVNNKCFILLDYILKNCDKSLIIKHIKSNNNKNIFHLFK